MQKQGKSRKGLIVGIVAAVVILAVLLVLLLTQCTGGQSEATTAPSTTVGAEEVPTYELYWNLDRAEYDGKSEAGMSSRMPEEDGYFHVRFMLDGKEVTLKVQDRKIINKIDVLDLMGLEFDENGIVIDCLSINDMPLEKVAWQFYVQSAGGKLIKANSSDSFGGMEVQLEGDDNTGVYDMSGKSGPVGCEATPIPYDRIYAVKNLAGELTHVFIYERINYMLTHEAECQHCEKTVTWYEWTREDKLPTTSGHYQLMNDITLDGQQSMSQQDQKICLDLNGKRVDGKNGTRMYSLHNAGSSLAIMDTSEGQTGVLAAHGTVSAQGVVVWVRYGQFHLYSGTLDASDCTTKYYGTTVTVPKNAYFYMHGGTLIGGTATWVKNSETGAYSRGLGGTLYVGGKFVMNGGEIRDGFAKSVTYKKNGTSTTTRGYGGNLFVAGGAEVELNGGVIKNGKAGSAGGNLYLDGACNVTMNGTQILYGQVTGKGKNGGSVYIGAKGTLTMNGGCISGGLSYNAGGNVYNSGLFVMNGGYIKGGRCYSYTTRQVNETSTSYNLFVVNGEFKMYGGRIYGGVSVTDTSTTKTTYISLSGNPIIKSDAEGAKNLTLNTGGEIQVKVGNLREKAQIGVYTARGVFTLPTKEENKDKFFSDIPEAEIIYTEEGLALGRMNCVCGKTDAHINGCDGTVYLWSPWISASSMPKTEGNYYFIKDVTTTSQYVTNKGETIRLDLNGFNATYKVPATYSDGFRLYRAAFESVVVITDTTDNPGTMRAQMATAAEVEAAVQAKVADGTYTQADADKRIAAQAAGNFGQVLWARGGDIVLHNGIIDGSNLVGSKTGMTVYVNANTASEDGGVTRKGSFTMYGGVIKGATSTGSGCSLYGSASSEIYIHGGVIENGTSTGGSGGNVYTYGQFTMDGGVIRGGKALSAGGNLVLDGSKAVGLITGNARIENGVTGDSASETDSGRGGNIRVVTKGAALTLSGDAVVTGGTAYRSASKKGGYAGNISVNTGTVMYMTGGTVENGTSGYRGGNIDVCGILNFSGGTVTGGESMYGGNMYVLNGEDRELNMTGGTIEKGYATYTGGNIMALGPVDITGGVVAEGKALQASGVPSSNNRGGNIYTCGELNISGDAVIRDGYTGGWGGNITLYVDGSLIANVTISGNAQILNGVADGQLADGVDSGYGGNIRVNSSTTLTVTENALISGGQAIGGKYNSTTKTGGGGQGGNLYMANATVNLLGGIIENGTATGGGGNIGASAATGTLLLQDVIVRDGDTGTSYGGNIRLRNGMGQMTVTGETQILGGTASAGGNIYIDGTSVANVEIGGQALVAGGNVGTANNGPTIYMGAKAHLTITDDAVIDATESVGKRGGAVYMSSVDASLTVDGNAALLGSNDAAMTHGTVGYLRGPVTVGGNAQLIAGKEASYGGAVYYYTGDMTLKDNAKVIATDNTSGNGSAIFLYQASATLKVQDNVEILGGETTSSGATIYFDSKGTLDISGGKIYGGKTAKNGGAIYTTGKVTMTGGTVYGGEASYGGAMYIYNSGSLIMSGGEIIGGQASKSGGALAIEANASPATLTITGGSITGGTADSNGGNVWLYSNKDAAQANATITGVTISGGSAVRGGNIYIGGASSNTVDNTLTLNDVTLSGGTATTSSGGNLYMVYSKVTMNGGEIKDGINGIDYTSSSDKPNGGNVYVGNSASFTMNGGSITGGKTINTGANLIVYGDMVMTDGTISGGAKINNAGEVTSTTASNLNAYLVSGNLTMSGGSIDGRVALYGDSKLNLSGNVNLHTADEVDGDLFLNGTTEPITITGSLGEERLVASIRLNDCTNVFSTETTEGNEKYFRSSVEGQSVFFNSDKKLEIGKVGCICGSTTDAHIGDCDGTQYNWTAWTSTSSMPTEAGFWYLTDDITITGKYSGKPEANTELFVDFNGHTVNYAANNGYRLYTTYNGGHKNNIHITFTDRSAGKEGKIIGTNQTTAENGPIVWLSCKGSELYVYHITIDGTELTTKEGKMGGVISATGSDAKVGLFNATILGGSSDRGDAIRIIGEESQLRLEGDVTITGTEGDALAWAGNPIDVSKLTSLNDVCIYGEGTFTTGFSGDSVKWFTTTEDRIIELRDGELMLLQYRCICDMPGGEHVEGFCDGTKYAWTPWTSTTTVPNTSGHYYLLANVDLGSSIRTITKAQDIVLDLNGFSITKGEYRMYTTQYTTDRSVAVNIVLTNTSSDTSTITVSDSGDQGRVVWLSGYNKSLKVYNLTVDTTNATTNSHGVAFSINTQNTTKTDVGGAYMGIYNTVFLGASGENGGNGSVLSASSGLNITMELRDVTIDGGYGYKADGTTGTNGGAIYMNYGKLIMDNVTVKNAESGLNGGAVYLGTNASAVLSGKISLDGKIADGSASGIWVTSGATVDVSDLAEGSQIGISGSAGVISVNDYESDDADLAYLVADNSEQYLAVRDGKLNLLSKECMCGMPGGEHVAGFCDQVLRAWQPWSGNAAPGVTGNYYLTGDLTVTETVDLNSKDAEIVIDLNGHDIYIVEQDDGKAGRMYTTYNANGSTSNVSIILTNRTSDESTVKVTGEGDQGRVMWLTGTNKELAVYNVNIDLSEAATRASGDTTARKDGIAIAVDGTGNTLKMYDSGITGGTTSSIGGVLVVNSGNSATLTRCVVDGAEVKTGVKDSSISGGYGGFAYVRGTLILNDCTIKNAKAPTGAGAIYVYGTDSANAKLIVKGGSFENCQATAGSGGAIAAGSKADIELTGVSFSGNSATTKSGGTIVVSAGCTAVVTNCTFENSGAKDGGAILVGSNGSTVELTNCRFTNCVASNTGGVAYIGKGSIATLINCTITSCSAKYAGAVYLESDDAEKPAKLVMTGGSIKSCSATTPGGSVRVSSNSDITLTDVSIEGSSATSGGAIAVYTGSTAELTNCTIKDCHATSNYGGAIYVASTAEASPAKLIMTGGSIENCTSASYGGAITLGTADNSVTYTEAELTNVKIDGCSAAGRAGGIHVSNGSTLVADGCTIQNCSATGSSTRGGALYSYKGNVTLLDTTIENNTSVGTSSALSGGVHLYGCSIALGGKIVVKNNTAGSNASGIYVQSDTRIIAAEDRPLSSGSEIEVYSDNPSADRTLSVTLPYSAKAYFISNRSTLKVVHDGTNLLLVSTSQSWTECDCDGDTTDDHVCKDVKAE